MDPVTPDVLGASAEGEEERVYLSCSPEDLIVVEMEAWQRGYQAAQAAPPGTTVPSLEAIAAAGKGACNQALLLYVPLDIERFVDVFVRAWCGGYCTRAQELTRSSTSSIIH
jgi:hypothetical protein